MKIAILAGGYSPERDVSLVSGSLIANALSSIGHKVFLIDVYEGLPSLPEDIDSLFKADTVYSHTISETEPDLMELKLRCGNREALIGPNVLNVCEAADVVFIALHGAMGENGQLQATLDSAGIKHYTGSGFAGSLLAMDKDISKKIFRFENIPTADWIMVDTPEEADLIEKNIGYPCVIKPNTCGSSCGVSIVTNRIELDTALSHAFGYERSVMAEKKIEGRELTVAILNNKTLPAVEIIPKTGFYDYKNKYQHGQTIELCPAPVSEETKEKLDKYARAGFKALKLEGYARFDFILDKGGELWCLEANTLPGMTTTSLLPREAEAAGIPYENLCDIIAKLAQKKN